MLSLAVALIVLSVDLPPECQAPPTREVTALTMLASSSGTLSARLDRVASFCFDSAGMWKGERSEVSSECAKAIDACTAAQAAISVEHRRLLEEALNDVQRPFGKLKYVPKRILTERPSDSTVNCASRERAPLYVQAQAQMDIARLAVRVQSEYGPYKTWLLLEGLKCAETVNKRPRSASIDAGPPIATAVVLGGPTAAREKALASSPLEKWRYFRGEQAKIETDIDWVAGFLASWELRECHCALPNPGERVRRLEKGERPAPEDDEAKVTQCQVCVLDAYPQWKTRSQKQCALAPELTAFELDVLERSEDGKGFPPRCAELAKRRHAVDAGQQVASAFVVAKKPEPVLPAASNFVKPQDYAPPLAREDGRVYLRIFTSAACITEVLPGPVQARNGDVLPLPAFANEMTVRGPCGGYAEIYFGREEKPRISESFAKNQPLILKFRTP